MKLGLVTLDCTRIGKLNAAQFKIHGKETNLVKQLRKEFTFIHIHLLTLCRKEFKGCCEDRRKTVPQLGRAVVISAARYVEPGGNPRISKAIAIY
jgi:hypothetical protein